MLNIFFTFPHLKLCVNKLSQLRLKEYSLAAAAIDAIFSADVVPLFLKTTVKSTSDARVCGKTAPEANVSEVTSMSVLNVR
jgi:hypothetical protein